MSLTLNPVTIAPGSSVSVPVQNPNSVQTIIISNKAYIDAVVTGIDNAGPRWLIAGTQDRFDASNGTFNGSVGIQGFNTANIPSTQVSVVLLTVYYDGDEVPNGSWPVSIPSQVVNNSVSVTSQIINDGNPANTKVVEATVAGSPGSNVLIQNDGTVTIAQYVASVLTNLFQIIPGINNGGINVKISDGNHYTDVLGGLSVEGTLSSNGSTTINGVIQFLVGSTQSLVNGSTIILNEPFSVVTNSAAVTGIIMSAGSAVGQVIYVYNSTNVGGASVTFAASGSRVKVGSNCSISPGRTSMFIWDGSNWTPCP